MADLMKTPGQADPLQGKNQEHVEKILPERVFLFFSFLFISGHGYFGGFDGEPVGIVMS